MKITYDPAKRLWTVLHRGLDFEDAPKVFAGLQLTRVDDRRDYGEIRYQTYGVLDGQVVMLVWTERGTSRRIISMRKADAAEKALYQASL